MMGAQLRYHTNLIYESSAYDRLCAPSGVVCIYQAGRSCLCYNLYMYHFVWVDHREKQGYKCDVSLGGRIQIICTLEDDATLYIGMAAIDGGFAFVNNIESLSLNFIAGCFLVGVGVGLLGHGAWGRGS